MTRYRRWRLVLTAMVVVAIGLVVAMALANRHLNHEDRTLVVAEVDPVAEAIRAGKPTVVEFGSDRCESCRTMIPILAVLAREHGDRLNVVTVDLFSRTGRRLIPKYQIQMMPTQVFFDAGGREVDRHLGPISGDDILRRLGLGPMTVTGRQ
ncbi:thioredoxin family protein [Rhodoplanes azumiensis]|uniref:Thioredoxin family protein n=1 Tax=Rhodoplanes azumiensis TaxID=1897628 RepID=A0ABW5AFJ0_9BRAD